MSEGRLGAAYRGYCKETRKKRKQKKKEKAIQNGKGDEGVGQADRGKQKEEEEFSQEEICRGKMEKLTFPEVD